MREEASRQLETGKLAWTCLLEYIAVVIQVSSPHYSGTQDG